MTNEMKPFTCSYQFEGLTIDFTCHARSWDEVSARLRAIGMTAVVNGEQISEVSAGAFGEGLGMALSAARALTKSRRAKS